MGLNCALHILCPRAGELMFTSLTPTRLQDSLSLTVTCNFSICKSIFNKDSCKVRKQIWQSAILFWEFYVSYFCLWIYCLTFVFLCCSCDSSWSQTSSPPFWWKDRLEAWLYKHPNSYIFTSSCWNCWHVWRYLICEADITWCNCSLPMI